MTHNPSLRNQPVTQFATFVRAALDELDNTPGDDQWTIRDANKLAEAILVHANAAYLARSYLDDPGLDPATGRPTWDTEV